MFGALPDEIPAAFKEQKRAGRESESSAERESRREREREPQKERAHEHFARARAESSQI